MGRKSAKLFQTLGRDVRDQSADRSYQLAYALVGVLCERIESLLLGGLRGSHLLHLVLRQNLPCHQLLEFSFVMIYHQVEFLGKLVQALAYLIEIRLDTIELSVTVAVACSHLLHSSKEKHLLY
jgi:hypothetical protein